MTFPLISVASMIVVVRGVFQVFIDGSSTDNTTAPFVLSSLTINGGTSVSPMCTAVPVSVSRNDGVVSSFVPSQVTLVPGAMNVLTDFDLFSGENGFGAATVLTAMFAANVNALHQTIVVIEVSGGDACVVSALNPAGAVIGEPFAALGSTYGPDLATYRSITTIGGPSSIGPVHGFALNFSDFRLPQSAIVRGMQLTNCPGLDLTWIGVAGCVERITLPMVSSTTTTTTTTTKPATTTTSSNNSPTTPLPPLTFGTGVIPITDSDSTDMSLFNNGSTTTNSNSSSSSATSFPIATVTIADVLPWWIYVVAAALCVCLVLFGALIGWFLWRRPREEAKENDSVAMSPAMARANDYPEMVSMEARSIVGSGNDMYTSAAIFSIDGAPPAPTKPLSAYVQAPARESIYANGNAFATQSVYSSTSQRANDLIYETTDAPLN